MTVRKFRFTTETEDYTPPNGMDIGVDKGYDVDVEAGTVTLVDGDVRMDVTYHSAFTGAGIIICTPEIIIAMGESPVGDLHEVFN